MASLTENADEKILNKKFKIDKTNTSLGWAFVYSHIVKSIQSQNQ